MLTTDHSLQHARTEDGRPYLDYECALELLHAVVADKGEDYIYEPPLVDEIGDAMCTYAVEEGGQLVPSCGVGQVLFRVDPELLALAHHYDPGVGGRWTGLRAMPLLSDDDYYYSYSMPPRIRERVLVDGRAAHLLDSFQRRQDLRVPYGLALDEAIAQVNFTHVNFTHVNFISD